MEFWIRKRRLAQFIGSVSAPICFVGKLPVAIREFDGVAYANPAAADHPAIEREPSIKAFLDLLKHFGRLFLRIRIPRGHDTTLAKAQNPNQRSTDAQQSAFPFAFGQPFDSPDQNVGAKTAVIVAQCRDSAIGCDKKRQNIKPFRILPSLKMGTRTNCRSILDDLPSINKSPLGVSVG